jgi:alpha-tubulin suppressor-like RCC1 family protein
VAALVALGLTTGGLPLASAAPVGVPPAGATGGAVLQWSTGFDNSSTIGQPGSELAEVPEAVTDGVVSVASGYFHNLALTTHGKVIAWAAGHGLCCGPSVGSSLEVPEEARDHVTAIAAGTYHSLALKEDGSVVSWGESMNGELASVPEAAGSDVTAIAAGAFQSLALKEDGSVVAWGEYPGSMTSSTGLPQAAGHDITAISAGGQNNLALTEDGSVVSWGMVYQPGLTNYTWQEKPVPAAVQHHVVAISAGYSENLALLDDGSVVSWATTQYISGTDVEVAEIDLPDALDGDVTAIAAGLYSSLALKADGSVVSWSALYGNSSGGPLATMAVPTEAGSGVTAIAAGLSYNLAVKTTAVAPTLTADAPAGAGVVGTPYDYAFTATGVPAPTFAVTAGELPAGLALNPVTGALSGTPTAAGTSTFTVTAGNGVAPAAEGTSHTITVTQAPALMADAPPASAALGTAVSYTFTAGGSPAPTFAVDEGVLPPGLTLDPTTGVLSGTPTARGAYGFAVRAANGTDPDALGTWHTMSVTDAPALTSEAPASTAPLGVPFTHTFTATGFPAPTFGVASGELPAGLTLDAESGVLSGTPTETGASTFTVAAGNGIGTAASTAAITLSVTAAPTLTGDAPPETAPVGSAYEYTFAADGFPAPEFTVSTGSLPPGLTLDAATGELSGTPTATGTWNYAVTASNDVDPDAVGTSHSLVVTAVPVFTADSPPAAATLGEAYSYAFSASGYPAPRFVVTSGTLPAGLTLAEATGVLSGTPATAGTSTFTVKATNGIDPATVGAAHTVTVTARPTAPGQVVAAGGDAQVTVSWTAPTAGGPVDHYRVEAEPGDAFCETTGLSCVLGGEAGESYEVTVTPVGPTGLLGPEASATSTPVATPPVSTAPPADAEFSLTTTEGPLTRVELGQEITVVGTGFLPFSTASIVIYSTPRNLGQVVTDAGGNFSATVTIPADLDGSQHSLVAYGVDLDGAVRSLRMDVTVPQASGTAEPVTGTTAGEDAGAGAGEDADGSLAYTGAGPVVPIAITGALLVVAGAALAVVARRRRTAPGSTD